MSSQQLDTATQPEGAIRIYIFKSETRKHLRAFAADPRGSKLPDHHGPWTATGIIGPSSAPPHKMSREAIEKAIATEGFQMWRLVDNDA
jgi:hypothetical protein